MEDDDPFRQQAEEDAERQRAEADKFLGDDPAYIQWVKSTEGNEYDEISSQKQG